MGYPYALVVDFKEWATPLMHVLLILKSGLPSLCIFVDFKEWATPLLHFLLIKSGLPLCIFVDFKEWATPPYAFLLILKSGLPLFCNFC